MKLKLFSPTSYLTKETRRHFYENDYTQIKHRRRRNPFCTSPSLSHRNIYTKQILILPGDLSLGKSWSAQATSHKIISTIISTTDCHRVANSSISEVHRHFSISTAFEFTTNFFFHQFFKLIDNSIP